MTSKKRLLFLTVAFDTGGTEKATFDIITHLNPEKYDITLMTMYGGGYFQDHLPPYVHVKCFFPKFIRYVIRYVKLAPPSMVYRTFIHETYDVEIACGDNIPSRIINYSPNKKSKKIAWIHMDVIARGYNSFELQTERGAYSFYKNFNHIVCVSKDCEKNFIKRYGHRFPTCTIYNLIDSDEIRRRSSEQPEFWLNHNTFNILCCGRLTEQKGFDRLLIALNSIKEKGIINITVTILGEGPDRGILERVIREYGLDNMVVLPGYVNNPYPIIKQADLFVLPSRDESFALVVAEAMVLGIPVISTRCAGPVELLRNGEAGMLVENNTDGIFDGLYKILNNPGIYKKMKDVANEYKDSFHMKEQIAQIEELFDD